MEIEYSTKHDWYKKITGPALENFSKTQKKRIAKTLPLLQKNEISISISEIDETFLNEFLPFYTKLIEKKDNPRVIDIKARLDFHKHSYKKYGLLVKENVRLIGGTVIINKNNKCTTAFKAYEHKWAVAKLDASPSLISEYFFTKHAVNYNYKTLSHGRDNNLYGQFSSIGLCAYKLSMGYRAKLPLNFQLLTLDSEIVKEPLLVMEKPTRGTTITSAHFFYDKTSLSSYEKLTKYPEQLSVSLHSIEE